jgi:excisionase family DNA binding protein
MDDPDKVLTVGEAAKLLGVGPKTLSAMVRSGKVPGFRIGERGYWRIKRRDIDKLMDPKKDTRSHPEAPSPTVAPIKPNP